MQLALLLAALLPFAPGAVTSQPTGNAKVGASPAATADLASAGLRHGDVARLALPLGGLPEAFGFDVPVHGASLRVELFRHSVRAEGFELLVQGMDGLIRSVEPAPVSTYRGHVVGYPESSVAASLIDGRVRAAVRLAPSLPPIGVEPLGRGAADEHLVYDAVDVLPAPVTCSLAETTFDPSVPTASEGAVSNPAAGTVTDEAQIAFDADVEFFQDFNSSIFGTMNGIEDKLNGVEAIYEPQTGLTYEISAILVRTAEPDPYSTSSSGSLLNQVKNHWQSSQGSIARDQTHLMTGRNLNNGIIGIAELNSICGNGSGYGLSAANFNGSNQLTSVGLIAHELGHNWNAPHCDGQSDCGIMCSSINNCAGGVADFGAQSVSRITSKKNSSTCLEAPAPATPLFDGTATPSVVAALGGGTVAILGEHLEETTEVRANGHVLPTNEWVSAWGELRLVEALFKDAGTVSIEADTPGGTASGVNLTVLEATDIELAGPALSIPGATLSYEWSGGAGNSYFFNFSFDASTIEIGGFDILANANPGLSGVLGSAGTDSFVVPSAGSLGFLTLWIQVLVFDTGGGSFLGATDLVSTLFL